MAQSAGAPGRRVRNDLPILTHHETDYRIMAAITVAGTNYDGVIRAGAREGPFALDEIFVLRERDSELDIAEHTTDTAGFTDLLFGAYDLVGLVFSPRIRNLADQRLWHLDDTALPALVEPLVANRINAERVVAPWDVLLQVGASIHEGRRCRRCC